MVLGVVCLSVFLFTSMPPGIVLADGTETGAERSASLRAYADPDSGELVPPPAVIGGGAAAAEDPPIDSTELELVPLPGGAGGLMVDLRGRFLHGVRAQASAEGVVSHRCDPKPDAAGK